MEQLPESDQESIGRQVLDHVEKLRALRRDIDAGIHALDAGEGREVDFDELIASARKRMGRHSLKRIWSSLAEQDLSTFGNIWPRSDSPDSGRRSYRHRPSAFGRC